jgi:hypothetical protein
MVQPFDQIETGVVRAKSVRKTDGIMINATPFPGNGSTVSLIDISGLKIDASKSGEDGTTFQISDSRFTRAISIEPQWNNLSMPL